MPTYEYECANCETNHEVVQKMSDPTLTECPACGESGLRKLFHNVGVVFKGSGFYRTDSRDAKKSNTGSTTSSSTSTATSTTTSDSSGNSSTSTPAASTTSSTKSSSTTSGSSASTTS